MWKWILIGIGVLLGISVFAFIIFTTVNPAGCVDFILTSVDEYNIAVDGESHRVKIDKLEGDVTPEDRAFLVKKLLALTIMAQTDEDYKEASGKYGRAFLEMAEDNTLTEEEYLELKEMFSEIVSDEDVEDWLRKAEELEKSEDFDPGELIN